MNAQDKELEKTDIGIVNPGVTDIPGNVSVNETAIAQDIHGVVINTVALNQ